jgi:hypothetical protein
MRFLLVGRHRETGEVRLVSPDTYPSRQEALDLLGATAVAGDLSDLDLLVVDLDVAVPVVFYQAPPVRIEPQEEPIADVWEAPAPATDASAELGAVEDAVLEGTPPAWGVVEEAEPLAAELEAAAQGMIAEPEPVVEPEPEPVVEPEPEPVVEPEPEPVVAETIDLVEALRRAATTMESQGIVAPPSVEEFASSVEVVAIEATLTESADGEQAPPDEPRSWPWESQPADVAVASGATVMLDDETLPLGEASQEPATVAEGPPTFEPVGIDEPGLEDITLLTPVSADSFETRPVIVGEYAEADPEDENPFSALRSLVSEESSAVPIGLAGDEDPSDMAPSTQPDADDAYPVDPVVPVGMDEAKGYEPGGTDIATYACADCVYVETCPKANQEGPATCGSFQWTSV